MVLLTRNPHLERAKERIRQVRDGKALCNVAKPIVTMPNQNPEQIARDQIDKHLVESGWIVQDKKTIDFSAGPGIVDTQMRKA